MDGKTLQFPSERRPASRFFFVRFILTYLERAHSAEAGGFTPFTTCGPLWTRPSDDVNLSVLKRFVYAVCGADLPHNLIETSFQKCLAVMALSEDHEESEEAEDAAVALAARWRLEKSRRKEVEFYESSDEDKGPVTNVRCNESQ